MVSECLLNAWLSFWLAEISADLRDLEALRYDALYKSTSFTFLYTALEKGGGVSHIVLTAHPVWRVCVLLTHLLLLSVLR